MHKELVELSMWNYNSMYLWICQVEIWKENVYFIKNVDTLSV